jgi:hypothetical protein
MTVFRAIIELTNASWRVFRRHPVLAAFPVLSLAVSIAILVLVMPMLVGNEPTLLAMFVVTFLLHLVHVFFVVGLTGEALKALRGENPSVAGGLATAMARPAAIVSFTAITSTVGFALSLLGRSSNLAMRTARALVGTVWSLATYLAIPVMVQESRGGVASLKRSGSLFRRTWGETTLSEVGVRVLTVHFALVLVIALVVLVELFGESLFALVVFLALAVAIAGIIGTLEAIYRAALYVFASEGVVPDPFAGPELDDIWQVK